MVSFASVISESVVFICLLSMIVYMNPTIALIIFVVRGLLGLLISQFLLPKFYYWGQKLQSTGIHTSQNLMQFFHVFKEVVLLGKREYFVNAYKIHSLKQSKVKAIQATTSALPRMGIEVLFVGIFVVIISYLSVELESPMHMIGLLSGYLYAGFRLMPGLNRIINQLNIFKSVIPSINRIHEEYTTIASEQYYYDTHEFTFEKSLTFKNIDYQYLNTDKKALSNIEFSINKGECIGVVGETGSGKSTLIDLQLGLLRPTTGEILIDDKFPVNSIQWHQMIGYVPQSIYLTDDTIEANIAFGEKDIDEEAFNKAINAAQLRGLIDALLGKSKTIVGERGIRLSGGERQRIAIARALYRNPEVLVFDEATSALDNETEARLIETIQAVCKERAVIMIAHRVTTLKDCDWIINIENGFIKSISHYDEFKALNTKKEYLEGSYVS